MQCYTDMLGMPRPDNGTHRVMTGSENIFMIDTNEENQPSTMAQIEFS